MFPGFGSRFRRQQVLNREYYCYFKHTFFFKFLPDKDPLSTAQFLSKGHNGRPPYLHLNTLAFYAHSNNPKNKLEKINPSKNATHHLFYFCARIQSSSPPHQSPSNQRAAPIMVSPRRRLLYPIRNAVTLTAASKTTYTQLSCTERAWCSVSCFWYSCGKRVQH